METLPANQVVMMKLLVNQALYAQGLQATQVLGPIAERDAPFGPTTIRGSSTS
ncbi:MAG TPA: hypothetical protein VE570_07390 [Thermoleophilaceae bacterium]|nr:hypothetical protein [Thermoleophilaceae bacterium]